MKAALAGSLGLNDLAPVLGAAVTRAHAHKAPLTVVLELPSHKQQLEAFLQWPSPDVNLTAAGATTDEPHRGHNGGLHGVLNQAFASAPWGHAAQIFRVPVLLLAYGFVPTSATLTELLVARTLQELLLSRFEPGSTLLPLSRDLVCDTAWPVASLTQALHAGQQMDADRQSALQGVLCPEPEVICGFLLNSSHPKYGAWVTNAKQPETWVPAALAAVAPLSAAPAAEAAEAKPTRSCSAALAEVSSKACSRASACTMKAVTGHSWQAQRIAAATAAAAGELKPPPPSDDLWLHEEARRKSAQASGVLAVDQLQHYSTVKAALAAVRPGIAAHTGQAGPIAALQGTLRRVCDVAATAVAAVGVPSESLAGMSAAAEYAAKFAEGELRSLAKDSDGKKLLGRLAYQRPDDEPEHECENLNTAQKLLGAARLRLAAAETAAEQSLATRRAAHAAYVQADANAAATAAVHQQLADAQTAADAACRRADAAYAAVQEAEQHVHAARQQLQTDMQPLVELKKEVQAIGAAAVDAQPLQRQERTAATSNACMLMALLNLTDYTHFRDLKVACADDLTLLLLRPCFWLLFCMHSILLIDHPRPACVLSVRELLSDELLWAAACEQWLPHEEVLVEWVAILQRACESLAVARSMLQRKKAAAAAAGPALAAAGQPRSQQIVKVKRQQYQPATEQQQQLAAIPQQPQQPATALQQQLAMIPEQQQPATAQQQQLAVILQQQQQPAAAQQQQLAAIPQQQPAEDELLFGEYADYRQLLSSAVYPDLESQLRLLPLRRLLMHTILPRVERASFLLLGLPFNLRHQVAAPSALAKARQRYEAQQRARASDPVRQHNEGYGESNKRSFKTCARPPKTATNQAEDQCSPGRPSRDNAAALLTFSATATAPAALPDEAAAVSAATKDKQKAPSGKYPKAHPKLAGVRGGLQSTKCRLTPATGKPCQAQVQAKSVKPTNPRELDSDADSGWNKWRKQAALDAAVSLRGQMPAAAKITPAAAVVPQDAGPRAVTVNPFRRVKKPPGPAKQLQQPSKPVAEQLADLGIGQLGIGPGGDAPTAVGNGTANRSGARAAHDPLFSLLQFQLPAAAAIRSKRSAAAVAAAMQPAGGANMHKQMQPADQQHLPPAAATQHLQHPAVAAAAVCPAQPNKQQMGISWPARSHGYDEQNTTGTAAHRHLPHIRQLHRPPDHERSYHHQQQQQHTGVFTRNLLCSTGHLGSASIQQRSTAAVASSRGRTALQPAAGLIQVEKAPAGGRSGVLLFDHNTCGALDAGLKDRSMGWPRCSPQQKLQAAQATVQQQQQAVAPPQQPGEEEDASELLPSYADTELRSVIPDSLEEEQQQHGEEVESALLPSYFATTEQPGCMPAPHSTTSPDAPAALVGGLAVATAHAQQVVSNIPVGTAVGVGEHLQEEHGQQEDRAGVSHHPDQPTRSTSAPCYNPETPTSPFTTAVPQQQLGPAGRGSMQQHVALPQQLGQQQDTGCTGVMPGQQLGQADVPQQLPAGFMPRQQQQGSSKHAGLRMPIQHGITRQAPSQHTAVKLTASTPAAVPRLSPPGAAAGRKGCSKLRASRAAGAAGASTANSSAAVAMATAGKVRKKQVGTYAAARAAIAALATQIAQAKRLQQQTAAGDGAGESKHSIPAMQLQPSTGDIAGAARAAGKNGMLSTAAGATARSFTGPASVAGAAALDLGGPICCDAQQRDGSEPKAMTAAAACTVEKEQLWQATAQRLVAPAARGGIYADIDPALKAGYKRRRDSKQKKHHKQKSRKQEHKEKAERKHKRQKREKLQPTPALQTRDVQQEATGQQQEQQQRHKKRKSERLQESSQQQDRKHKKHKAGHA